MDAEPQSFTQGERDMWSGLLDQEYIMQSSRSLVQAFKTDKPRSAAKLLAQHSLSRLFPLRRRIIGPGRRQYQKHFKTLNQALLQARAGTDALELILASKTLPMYSWTDSFYSHPIATLHSTVAQAFEDAVNGVSGLFSNEVKSSCFSFAYRVNSIAPYTAVYPGGILGNIMNGLIRSYLLVFQHSLINFKGIFALLIGVVCKTRIIQAAVSATQPIFRFFRKGMRAIQILKSKTIAMRGDPIGRGLMDRMFKREAVVLTTILFQLHAVNVEEQYEHADNIKTALSGSGGSWSLAEGLFIGAAEFARAFHSLVIQYTRSADAYVKICKHIENEAHKKDVELQDFSEEGTGDYIPAESRTMQNLADEALEFFPEAHPEASGADEPLNTLQKLELLNKSCRKNSGFVAGYTTRKLYYVKRVIGHMVRVLQYYFKYFKSYIADILSIFYETALAMLETKINDSLGTPEGVTTQAEEMAAAEARHAARKSAAQSAIEDSQLPRKIFRAMKFAKESQNLAHGFYKAAGAFSLLHLAETHEEDDAEATKLVALELLTQGEASMRSGLGTIYERFLNSEVLLSRVVKSKKRLKVFELLAKCHTPLEERSEDAKSVCGKIVTSEIDKDEFIASALFSLNLPISGPLNDIAFYSTGTATRAFELWAQYSAAKGKKNALQIANRNVDNGRNAALIEHLRNEVNEKVRSAPQVGGTFANPELTFRRFEVVEHTAKIILYDENGRSLTFTGDDQSKVAGIAKPDPLDCTSRFKIKESNHGTLVFYLASGQRAGEKSGTRDPTLAAQRELSPAIELEGKLEYNDERKELSSIQNDPTAIRDTITAHFVEKQGRVTAETISGLLMMLHSRLPIFWKRSPVEFLQNLTPKMFFDALMILSTQAYDQTEATSIQRSVVGYTVYHYHCVHQEDIERYANAFVRKLAELKGQVTWLSYLNLDYFNKSAKIYAKTAAKYSYQVLYNQLNDLSGSPEEESELARLMKKLHPSLSGYRPPRPKKKSGFIAMLARFRENIGILPRSVRQKVIDTIRNCVARMRRFLGSRRISPRVIQGPHFMGALKYAEIATYPDPDSQREVLIEVSDLEEFGKVLLTLETVAATLDSPQAMYNTVTQVRATPAFTPSARPGAAGVNMALGLLALLDTSGTYIDKALQLQYLTAEALAFLNSSLDLGYLLMHLPEQTPADVKAMRFLTDAIRRVEAFLTGISKGMEGSSFYEWCNTLVSRELKGPLTATTSFSSEMLLASDAFGLCFLLLKLRDHAGAGMDTIKIEDILQTVYIDQQPVSEHLKFLQERNADIDERKLRVKYIEKFLQYMLVATIESLGIHLGAINFRSYDGETKVLSFQYTKQEASPPGAPAETLTFAADLLLGPQFLLEWYRYLMPKKLREFVDAARDNKATVSYAEMRKLSNVYTVTDLADLAYSVRQSSRINAGTVAREAALRVMENEAVPPLTRYGLGHMLVDVVSQAELVKRKCIGKTLDEYDTFRSSPLLERELFKYDCFYTKISESSAFADVANNLNEAHIREVMEAIDTAYEKEAEVLYNKLLNSEVPHTKVAKMAFKSMEEFPIADMADNLLPEFIVWVREKKPWGTAKRRRFPVLAPLNRLKALYATIKPGRKSLADYNNDLRSRKSLAAEQLDRYMSQFPEEPVEQPLEVNETQ
ncbi:hypothetical protein cyc_02950 [Cyclospora cayetanensis]|uniref:Rhoptry neck protein n=1 Tax=Cyclospora cayetanensis TaxID=88456 RepID=A0A1D3D204_9EIME|nr:hypothetical protein cyc_02950 [Cyclospora cayetanensis]